MRCSGNGSVFVAKASILVYRVALCLVFFSIVLSVPTVLKLTGHKMGWISQGMAP